MEKFLYHFLPLLGGIVILAIAFRLACRHNKPDPYKIYGSRHLRRDIRSEGFYKRELIPDTAPKAKPESEPLPPSHLRQRERAMPMKQAGYGG